MKITKDQFEQYWKRKGRLLRIKNAERFHQNLANKIEEYGDTVALDEYVVNLKKGKEVNRKVVTDFYQYLGESASTGKPDSSLYNIHFFDYPFERQLEIAKYLHTERTTAEIQEHFHIDARTVRSDLQELEEGISIMGSTIQISKEKRGRRYYYRTTLHPVFLPLNLTEVYALTVYLNRTIRENDPNASIIKNISDRITGQLSPYALQKLFPEEETRPIENKYVDDEALARQRKGIIMYLMKSGRKCRFLWEGKEYVGRIIWKDNKYRIQTDNGILPDADLSDVEFIIDSLEYE